MLALTYSNMETPQYTADLRAGFVGLRFLPDIIALGTNNLNPKLILRQEAIEYRGAFFTSTIAYSDVEKVAVAFIGRGTNNLTITPRIGLTTFTGNFRHRSQLYQFLAFLSSKGCPLTPHTQQLLAQHQEVERQ